MFFFFLPDAISKRSERKGYLMSKALPTIWQTTIPFKFSSVSSGKWLGLRFLKSVADGHNDSGVLGVTAHESWAVLFWVFPYLAICWECLCTSQGRVKQEEPPWRRSRTGQQQAPKIEVSWNPLLELFDTSVRKQVNFNSACVTYIIFHGCRIRGGRRGASSSLAEWALCCFILRIAAVNYWSCCCHAQSSFALQALVAGTAVMGQSCPSCQRGDSIVLGSL